MKLENYELKTVRNYIGWCLYRSFESAINCFIYRTWVYGRCNNWYANYDSDYLILRINWDVLRRLQARDGTGGSVGLFFD